MTRNQIDYQRLLEDRRKNRVAEAAQFVSLNETQRHNVATEDAARDKLLSDYKQADAAMQRAEADVARLSLEGRALEIKQQEADQDLIKARAAQTNAAAAYMQAETRAAESPSVIVLNESKADTESTVQDKNTAETKLVEQKTETEVYNTKGADQDWRKTSVDRSLANQQYELNKLIMDKYKQDTATSRSEEQLNNARTNREGLGAATDVARVIFDAMRAVPQVIRFF